MGEQRRPWQASDLPSRAGVFEALRRQLRASDTSTIVHLTGPSGVGKTDVIEGLAAELKGGYVTLGPYDFFFVDLFRPSQIESQIIRAFSEASPRAAADFASYTNRRERLASDRLRTASFYELQQELRDAFLEGYVRVAASEQAQGRPLVLLFDSIKHSVALPDPAAQAMLGSYSEPHWGGEYWLADMLPRLPNTVAVLAGRDVAPGGYQGQLYRKLEEALGERFVRVPIAPLDAADHARIAREILAARPDLEPDAAQLEAWYALGEGRTFWLMLLGTAALAGTLPPALGRGAGPLEDIAGLREQLVRRTFISPPAGPLTSGLRRMAFLRKGLTRDLLAHLEPESDADARFAELAALPIVVSHQRPLPPRDDGAAADETLLVLHEDAYALVEEYAPTDAEVTRRTIDWYTQERIRVVNEARADVSEAMQETSVPAEIRRLRERRDDLQTYRQQLDLDRLYYYFQSSLAAGLQAYNLLTYNAILQREYGYNITVRQEGLRGIYRHAHTPDAPLPLDRELESAAHWVLRAAHIDPNQIDWLVGAARPYLDRPGSGVLAQAFLKLAIGQALLLDGRPDNDDDAMRLLAAADRSVTEAGQPPQGAWDGVLLAQIAHWRGTAFSRAFAYRDAAEAYRRSYSLARRFPELSRGLQVQTLIELALASSEQGESEDGRHLGALALREELQLGSTYHIAMVYNTLARIEIRGGRPLKALDYAKRARDLIMQLDLTDGLVDILLTLSEAYRKVAEDTEHDRPRMRESFRDALGTCDEIMENLAALPKEDRRRCDVVHQRGVIHRSRGLVRARRLPGGMPDAEALADFRQARHHLQEALDLARALDVPRLSQIDIAEDLAAVDVHEEKFGPELERRLAQAEEYAPDEYKFQERVGMREIPSPIHGYWRELGQCQLQRMMQAFGLYEHQTVPGADAAQRRQTEEWLRAAGRAMAHMIGYLLYYGTSSWMLRRAEQLAVRELQRLCQRSASVAEGDRLLDIVLLSALKETRVYAIPIDAQVRIERLITRTRRDRDFDYTL